LCLQRRWSRALPQSDHDRASGRDAEPLSPTAVHRFRPNVPRFVPTPLRLSIAERPSDRLLASAFSNGYELNLLSARGGAPRAAWQRLDVSQTSVGNECAGGALFK